MTLVHWPTLLLIIGLPVYYIELAMIRLPGGHTSWLAAALAAGCAIVMLRRTIWTPPAPALPAWFMWPAALGGGLVLAIACYAGIMPPHLPQEYDVINYHITIPRQHLIAHNLDHLPWSIADLYLSPLDYALAPYWLATPLPNKFPQVIFFIGLVAVLMRLVRRYVPKDVQGAAAWSVMAAVIGTHAIGIQAGTGMLDVLACFLFFAALDSVLSGWIILAAIEFAFFFWSKSFMPFWILASFALTLMAWVIYARTIKGAAWHWAFFPSGDARIQVRKFAIGFGIASLCIAGPFLWRSLHYTGSPVYPLGCGMFNAALKDTPLCAKAEKTLEVREAYGTSRGPGAFLAHLWWVAVPEQGVNNRFDYPLGLTFLLCAVPFTLFTAHALKSGHFPVLPVWTMVYWGLWWTLGSRQSRFLFVPLCAMLLTTIAGLWTTGRFSKILQAAVLVSLMLTAASVARAHKADWFKNSTDVLRSEDKALLAQAAHVRPGEVVVLDRPDAAFAPFLIDVKDLGTDFVIAH